MDSKLAKVGDTVWITKWALTRGIIQAEVKSVNHDTARVRIAGVAYNSFLINKEAWLYEQAARNKALEMRDSKVNSLEKQLKRLFESLSLALSALRKKPQRSTRTP